jgi:ubiquinone/menaquinone biosynthesis C-methylase UbiE
MIRPPRISSLCNSSSATNHQAMSWMETGGELARNKVALRRLYSTPPLRRAWNDDGNNSFIGIHLVERSIALLAPELSGDLLDVGCGTNPYSKYFQHVRSKRNCDYSAERGTVDFVSSAVALPIKDNSFDAILCTEVLEHVPDPLATWREFYRVLRPNGKVLLSTPMYWPSHEQPYDFYRYPEHGLRYCGEQSGFFVRELIPRGGVWALWGQVTLQVMPQYFRLRAQRRFWSHTVLALDRWRCNAKITLGWTMLAEKPPA